MKKKSIYRQPKGRNLFEEELTKEALSKGGNPLEPLSELVDFEMFRPLLEEALLLKERKSPAGRPRIDVVLLFKVLFLQRFYGLGDHQIEYQIIDRTSFRQFLGIQTVDEVPDEKTIWAFRERLKEGGTFDALFVRFREFLDSKGLRFSEGKIIDASFVEAPRQRNSREENEKIKKGEGAELWTPNESDTEEEKAHKQHKKCHKDTDARWGKKRGVSYYGFKWHVKADRKTKLIEKYHTTPANVHDSNVIAPLIEETDRGQHLYLDSGYEAKDEIIKAQGMHPVICEKGHKGAPLTSEQKGTNRIKSKTRCRIEHIFGAIEMSMHGSFVRRIGLARAMADTALTSLVYNILRFTQICKYHHYLISEQA